MTWGQHFTGHYHKVVKDIKGFKAGDADTTADDHGHTQLAKDAALLLVDGAKQQDATFNVALSGHSSTKQSYSVQDGVTATQAQPEQDNKIIPEAPPKGDSE